MNKYWARALNSFQKQNFLSLSSFLKLKICLFLWIFERIKIRRHLFHPYWKLIVIKKRLIMIVDKLLFYFHNKIKIDNKTHFRLLKKLI